MISEFLSLAPTVTTEGNLTASESPYHFKAIADTKSSSHSSALPPTLNVHSVDSSANTQNLGLGLLEV